MPSLLGHFERSGNMAGFGTRVRMGAGLQNHEQNPKSARPAMLPGATKPLSPNPKPEPIHA